MLGNERTLQVESTLPKPWEVETTFHDALYAWMERAPWLMISGVAHLLVFFVLMSIPWDHLRVEEPPEVFANVEQPVEDPFEEPPPEEPEEPVETSEELDDPQLTEVPLEPTDVAEAFESAEGDTESEFETEFDAGDAFSDLLGIGGGGPPGGKFSGRGLGGRRGGGGYETQVQAGLNWLARHQSVDGSWDGDDFHQHCGSIGGGVCDGAGHATHDVGLTGLALLAFLGVGNSVADGPYRDVVARGMRFLRGAQEETGLIGERATHEFLYDHAIATLALAENYALSRSPQYKRPAQEAVYYLQRARNPYGAWRYAVPPDGDADTSVTGWALFALATAREAGLIVDEEAFTAGLAFLDEVTDPVTGRVGYANFGELSSRTPANEHFPREKGETMTAVGLLCRIFLGQTPEEHPVLDRHADLLRRTPPQWDPEGFGCDMYYWYYGTYAAFQMGGTTWKTWRGALRDAVVNTQRTDGDAAGSWDPVGPWGYVGGRVYATAIQTLTLEVYQRYAPLLTR